MKKLGLIGGISWVSTMDYYRLLNEGINERLGALNFSECLIYSFNYEDIKRNNDNNDWESTYQMLSVAVGHLRNGGAEAILLCANTMHMIADRLQENMDLPLIHIAEATAKSIEAQGLTKVALLGTKFTMEEDFFKKKLVERGIDALISTAEDRDFIHYTIFEELGRGIIKEETKRRYLDISNRLIEDGAQGIILGCTEIPLLISPEDVNVPVFDTTRLHVEEAIAFSLS